MSYNGIGLATARGSGTNGHVQRNLAAGSNSYMGVYERRVRHAEQEQRDKAKFKSTNIAERKVDTELAEHERKRTIEVKCFELRDELEEQGLEEEEIDNRVDELRERLTKKRGATDNVDGRKRFDVHKVNDMAAAKMEENKKFARAFEIDRQKYSNNRSNGKSDTTSSWNRNPNKNPEESRQKYDDHDRPDDDSRGRRITRRRYSSDSWPRSQSRSPVRKNSSRSISRSPARGRRYDPRGSSSRSSSYDSRSPPRTRRYGSRSPSRSPPQRSYNTRSPAPRMRRRTRDGDSRSKSPDAPRQRTRWRRRTPSLSPPPVGHASRKSKSKRENDSLSPPSRPRRRFDSRSPPRNNNKNNRRYSSRSPIRNGRPSDLPRGLNRQGYGERPLRSYE